VTGRAEAVRRTLGGSGEKGELKTLVSQQETFFLSLDDLVCVSV